MSTRSCSNPVALGKGRTMFDGMVKMLSLKLIKHKDISKWKSLSMLSTQVIFDEAGIYFIDVELK